MPNDWRVELKVHADVLLGGVYTSRYIFEDHGTAIPRVYQLHNYPILNTFYQVTLINW